MLVQQKRLWNIPLTLRRPLQRKKSQRLVLALPTLPGEKGKPVPGRGRALRVPSHHNADTNGPHHKASPYIGGLRSGEGSEAGKGKQATGYLYKALMVARVAP